MRDLTDDGLIETRRVAWRGRQRCIEFALRAGQIILGEGRETRLESRARFARRGAHAIVVRNCLAEGRIEQFGGGIWRRRNSEWRSAEQRSCERRGSGDAEQRGGTPCHRFAAPSRSQRQATEAISVGVAWQAPDTLGVCSATHGIAGYVMPAVRIDFRAQRPKPTADPGRPWQLQLLPRPAVDRRPGAGAGRARWA
jgi:hypothetical protein